MTLLDRHIFRSVLFTCLAAVSLFAFVVLSVNVIRDLIGPVLAGQISGMQFVRLTLLWIPLATYYALPMGMLTGILLTLGRLSADNEITAMRAAGLSLARISLPIFALGLLGMLAGLPVNFKAMPWARVQYEHEFNLALRANPQNFLVPKTFIHNFPDKVIYVDRREGSELRDVWLWQLDDQKRANHMVHSLAGHVDFNEATAELVVTLVGVQEIEPGDKKNPEEFVKESPGNPSFERISQTLPASALFQHQTDRQKLSWMTYGQLLHERLRRAELPVIRGQEREHAQSVMQVTLTIMDKFTTALAVFTFTIMGVPLGIKVSRRETSANLGLAVGLALSYYFLTVMVGWLDRHPEYRPDLILWVPNLIFLVIGLSLFRRLDRT